MGGWSFFFLQWQWILFLKDGGLMGPWPWVPQIIKKKKKNILNYTRYQTSNKIVDQIIPSRFRFSSTQLRYVFPWHSSHAHSASRHVRVTFKVKGGSPENCSQVSSFPQLHQYTQIHYHQCNLKNSPLGWKIRKTK